jgi:hypothetical protein
LITVPSKHRAKATMNNHQHRKEAARRRGAGAELIGKLMDQVATRHSSNWAVRTGAAKTMEQTLCWRADLP